MYKEQEWLIEGDGGLIEGYGGVKIYAADENL